MEEARLLRIELQYFAGEKTEKPTGRQRQKIRSKGQVARSMELNSAIILLLTFFVLKIYSGTALTEMANFSRNIFSNLNETEITYRTLFTLFSLSALTVGKVVLPVVAVAMVGGVTANIIQVGFKITTQPLVPDLSKINLIAGMKRFFNLRSLVELLKATLKIILVGYFVYGAIKKDIRLFPTLMDNDLIASLGIIARMTWNMALRVGVIMLVLAVFDYIYQRWEFEKSIKMSKQEIKEEHKMVDGDPQIRAKIREKQRQVSMRRMIQEVPRADVVITNPTHFAIALKYEEKDMTAPTVIAKGADYIALKIRSVAEENRVPMVENPPLAQSLYHTVEIGQEVPADLYQAVAEVLAFVYRLKGRI